MPLSKLEREVLEVIYKEHRQTHRGAREDIVFIAMGAVSCKDKSRILFAMQALNERDLIVARPDAWAPTKEGVNFIEQPGWIGVDMAMPGADWTASCGVEGILPEGTRLLEKGERVITDDPRLFSRKEISDVFRVPARLLGNRSVSHDLISRCAAMNAALLAQAEQAHAAGDPDAWRDLHWLIETGKQLVATGGDS